MQKSSLYIAESAPVSASSLFGDEWTELVGGELPPKEVIVKEHKRPVRREVVFTPPSVKVVEYVQAAYKCTECGKDADTPFDNIVKAPVPVPLLTHSIVSASLIAWIMYQKFAMSVPLYRQEKDWHRMLFPLMRLRMANWIIRCSETYLVRTGTGSMQKFKKGADIGGAVK